MVRNGRKWGNNRKGVSLHFKNTLKTTIEEMQITFKANTDTVQGKNIITS